MKTTNEKTKHTHTANEWKIYRTRFLVRAKQLIQPVTFIDALGREHHGEPGDYLVESSDGTTRVASRAIFEDIYVAMPSAQSGKLTRIPETGVSEKKPYGYQAIASA